MDGTCYKASTQHKLTIVQTEASRQKKETTTRQLKDAIAEKKKNVGKRKRSTDISRII
jgi:hypothetical protein